MSKEKDYQPLRFLISFWPLAHIALLVGVVVCPELEALGLKIAVFLGVLYLLPPVLNQILFLIFGEPSGCFSINSKPALIWYASSQLQIIFLRLPVLEEVLRMIPRGYSLWLRLWGAKIGKIVFWSPQVKIMDRPLLDIGDCAVVGFGATIASHFVKVENKKIELLVERPKVGAYAILGGLSGLSPGAEVGPGEMLPATLNLAPGYIWQGGRRHRKESSK